MNNKSKFLFTFIITVVTFAAILVVELIIAYFLEVIPCYQLTRPGYLYPMQIHQNKFCSLNDLDGITFAPFWTLILCANIFLFIFSGLVSFILVKYFFKNNGKK